MSTACQISWSLNNSHQGTRRKQGYDYFLLSVQLSQYIFESVLCYVQYLGGFTLLRLLFIYGVASQKCLI